MVSKLVRPLLVVCFLINLSICEEQEIKLQADDGVKNGVEFVGRMISEGMFHYFFIFLDWLIIRNMFLNLIILV